FSTIASEIAREVGREHVQVTDLIRPDVDPHAFESGAMSKATQIVGSEPPPRAKLFWVVNRCHED
ncbi:MAG: hypothetical protein WCP62_17120, partial [Planctomycetota bacterium]